MFGKLFMLLQQSSAQQERTHVMVAVTKDGLIWIDQQQIDIRAVRSKIEQSKANNPEGGVMIMADRASQTGLAIEVLDQIRLAGVTNIAFAATAKPN